MPKWNAGQASLAGLLTAQVLLLCVSVANTAIAQKLFVHTTYYFMLGMVLCWAGTYLHSARHLRRDTYVAWFRDNWPGLLTALLATVIAGLAVDPALRILSDEANLIGTSKNLFATKTATFTVSGKNYYGSYWDIDVAIDRRPTLFPFLVSLVHTVCGYSHRNAFLLNQVVLFAFSFVAYRLAKSLGGGTVGLVASLLVLAHPITLISARSGGFDLLAASFGLLCVHSLLAFLRERTPNNLAILWMNSCMLAEVRYESALFVAPVVALLLLFRTLSWDTLRPYAFIYSLTPAYLLPRVWQSILRGNVPEQDPGTVTFSIQNFLNNAHEYFQPILDPSGSYPAHSASLIALGIVGCVLWSRWLYVHLRAREYPTPEVRFAAIVAAWMLLQVVVVFSYFWGRAQYPSAARLVIPIDTFFSFGAAWALVFGLRRFRPFVSVLAATALFAIGLPVASQHRMMNRLTQTRENAATWGFFERLPDQRILIVTDRPNHFTIMDYGAMSFESARNDPYLLTAFERHLFQDVYVIQQIQLSTNEPLPGYQIWPERRLDAVFEFQNDANVLVRISRLVR